MNANHRHQPLPDHLLDDYDRHMIHLAQTRGTVLVLNEETGHTRTATLITWRPPGRRQYAVVRFQSGNSYRLPTRLIAPTPTPPPKTAD